MFNKINPNWNKSVISITILLSLVLSIFVIINPIYSSKILSSIYTNLSNYFESFYMYGTFALLLFLFFIAISKYGSFRVVLKNKPTYSMLSWSSMLFAGGIGATLLYWSTVEWIDYLSLIHI